MSEMEGLSNETAAGLWKKLNIIAYFLILDYLYQRIPQSNLVS
jgi:hypothetical protein